MDIWWHSLSDLWCYKFSSRQHVALAASNCQLWEVRTISIHWIRDGISADIRYLHSADVQYCISVNLNRYLIFFPANILPISSSNILAQPLSNIWFQLILIFVSRYFILVNFNQYLIFNRSNIRYFTNIPTLSPQQVAFSVISASFIFFQIYKDSICWLLFLFFWNQHEDFNLGDIFLIVYGVSWTCIWVGWIFLFQRYVVLMWFYSLQVVNKTSKASLRQQSKGRLMCRDCHGVSQEKQPSKILFANSM